MVTDRDNDGNGTVDYATDIVTYQLGGTYTNQVYNSGSSYRARAALRYKWILTQNWTGWFRTAWF